MSDRHLVECVAFTQEYSEITLGSKSAGTVDDSSINRRSV